MVTTPVSHLSFGADLRERRIAANLSLQGLAARVYYSRSHLSKVENGLKDATFELAQKCDTALVAGGALASRVERPAGRRSARRSPAAPPSHGDVPMINLAEYIATGSHAGATDPADVASFRGTFDTLRGFGQRARPVAVIPSLLVNAQTLTTMARDARPAVRNDLFRLAARFAEHAGWMAQELGDNDRAVAWTDWATQLAQHGGEDMSAYRLVRFGDLSMYEGDAERTIEYATMALNTTQNLRVRGIAAQRLAHGHALAQDRDACLRALELSGDLLARATAASDDEPVFGSSTVADHHAMASGWCLSELRQPSEAAHLLAAEVDRLPEHAYRARARYGTRLARCYADMGDLDRACATAEPMLRLMPSLDSATIRIDVAALENQFRRHRKHPAVRNLLPLVANARPRHGRGPGR